MLVSLLRLFLVQAHLGCVKRLQNGFVTLRAKLCSTVYCNRSCLWVCLCVEGVRVCVLVSVPTITRNCLHRSSPNWVRRWSDHLQLIKFWPSCIPEKGVCGWAKNFWLHLATASAQCLRGLCALFSFNHDLSHVTFTHFFSLQTIPICSLVKRMLCFLISISALVRGPLQCLCLDWYLDDG